MTKTRASLAAVTCTLVFAGLSSIDNRAAAAQAQTRERTALTSQQVSREDQLAALRLKAEDRRAQDLAWYSAAELRDIEARYLSTRLGRTPFVDSRQRLGLEALAAEYPRSNRAGCAVLELAQLSAGDVRERYLKVAIDEHADAWFANGAQVGPLAMALLAVHYAGLDRLIEAERVAAEIFARYPGSVDSTGASLDEVLAALKLLRPRK
jgi:hypothetical protein